MSRVLAVFLLALIAAAGTAHAAARHAVGPLGDVDAMREGRPVGTPLGYLQYCRDHPIDCRRLIMPVRTDDDGELIGAAAPMALDAMRWHQLVAASRRVNHAIAPRSDLAVHGVADVWSLWPAAGDCEDYALTKRRVLLALGWPARSLLIALARDGRGREHAVLIARTDRGDLVLDNLRDEVVGWTALPYAWIKRQSIANPPDWVAIDNDGDAIALKGRGDGKPPPKEDRPADL